jgi:hypothetical protein
LQKVVQALGGLREGHRCWGEDAAERPRVNQATMEHSTSIDGSSTS